nr:hypothetical protein [Achromobacter dolens]
MRIAQPDLRQPAARLHATTNRRRAWPALGSDPGAGRGVNRMTRRDARGTPQPGDSHATPARRAHRPDRQRAGHRHRMALSARR